MAARITVNGEIPEHGTLSRYRYRKCRCDECRQANTIARRIERTGDPTRGMRTSPHGARRRYISGCRCALCRRGNREYQKAYMARKRLEGKAW